MTYLIDADRVRKSYGLGDVVEHGGRRWEFAGNVLQASARKPDRRGNVIERVKHRRALFGDGIFESKADPYQDTVDRALGGRTLKEVGQQMMEEREAATLAEILSQSNEILDDIPWQASSMPIKRRHSTDWAEVHVKMEWM